MELSNEHQKHTFISFNFFLYVVRLSLVKIYQNGVHLQLSLSFYTSALSLEYKTELYCSAQHNYL